MHLFSFSKKNCNLYAIINFNIMDKKSRSNGFIYGSV